MVTRFLSPNTPLRKCAKKVYKKIVNLKTWKKWAYNVILYMKTNQIVTHIYESILPGHPAELTSQSVHSASHPFAVGLDIFYIVSSLFKQDRDHARLPGRGSDWFSGSVVRLGTREILPPIPLVVFQLILFKILVKISIELK